MSQERISSTFAGVTWLLIVSGMYIPWRKSTGESCKTHVPKLVGSILFAVISICSTSKAVYNQIVWISDVPLHKERGMLHAGSIVYWIFHLYLAIFLLYATSRHLPKFLSCLDKYQATYGSPVSVRKARLFLIVFSIVIVLSQNAAAVFMLKVIVKFCMAKDPDALTDERTMNQSLCDDGGYSFTIVHGYLHAYFELFHLASTFFLYLVIAVMLGMESRRLNKVLSSEPLETLENKPQYLEFIRLRHGKLCTLIAESSVCLRHFLFPLYVFGIPFLLVFVKGCVDSGLGSMFLGWAVFDVMQVAFIMTVVTLLGAWVSCNMHQPTDLLFQLNIEKMPGKGSDVVAAFLSRLQGAPIGFNVFHLFTVDTSTILMVCGTILTYAVVIMQFQPAPEAVNTQILPHTQPPALDTTSLLTTISSEINVTSH